MAWGPTDRGRASVLTRRTICGSGRRRGRVRHRRHRSLGVFTQTEKDTAQYQDERAKRSDAKPIGSVPVNVVGAKHRGLPTNGRSQRHKPFRRRFVPMPGGIDAQPAQVPMVEALKRARGKVLVTSPLWPSDHAPSDSRTSALFEVLLNLPQTWVLRQSSHCADRLVSRNLRKMPGKAARSAAVLKVRMSTP